ncbi:MAG: DMT family transporter [Pseudomonadota bacterium]
MTSATSPDRTLAGIGWMLLTSILFVGVTGIVRNLGSELPATQAAFIRYLAGLILILPLMTPLLRHRPSKRQMSLYTLRGVFHGIGVMLWFYAMARIPIAEVTAIGYIAPIFVTIGAAIFLGEAIQLRRIMAVLIAFCGTLIILRPGFQELSLGQLAQLCAAPLFAASFLFAKKFTDDAPSGVIVGMLSLFCTITLLPGAILHWRDPTLEEVAWLTLTAVLATLGHYTMTQAFRCAPVTVTQPVGFLQLVWATILGVVAFGEPIDPFVLLGGGIIVASATYISHREAVRARNAQTPPAAATKI